MDDSIRPLVEAVQRNCDIADARHARDYTLCTYLLKMREFYRWQQGLDFTAPLSPEAVGRWVEEKEALWRALEHEAFVPLPVEGLALDPFDREVTRRLLPRGLLYGSGYGRLGRPVFFLTELLDTRRLHGYTLHVGGREYARELSAPPAMAQGKTLIVRKASVRRMLWERMGEAGWKRRPALERTRQAYGFGEDPAGALDRMAEDALEAIIAHEVGEAMAGELLGEAWDAMVMALAPSKAELMARAVRDHLADCLSTLPRLLAGHHPPSLHAYFAQFDTMRRHLYPSLYRAYEAWAEGEGLTPLKEAVERGRGHWLGLAREMAELYRLHGEACAPRIEALVAARIL